MILGEALIAKNQRGTQSILVVVPVLMAELSHESTVFSCLFRLTHFP